MLLCFHFVQAMVIWEMAGRLGVGPEYGIMHLQRERSLQKRYQSRFLGFCVLLSNRFLWLP